MMQKDIVYSIQEEKLPPKWEMATIGTLVGENGVFVDGDWVESKDQDPNGDVRLIQLADIGDGEYRNRSERFLTHDKAVKLGCTFLAKGDVLVARMPDPLGRACTFPGDSKKSVTVVDVAVIRPSNGEFDTKWLMYFINAPAFRRTIASMESGSTRKRISRRNLSKIALPVPPLPQQKLIVSEIEKQFSRLDEAIASLKRIKANLKRYNASVLKAAVEGKLTEEWRKNNKDVGPAEKLLKRILAERKKKWEEKNPSKKYKEPAFPDTSILPDLPKGWVWATVEQLTEYNRPCAYGVLQPGLDLDDGIPLVRVGDINEGHIEISSLKKIASKIANNYPRTCLQGGEVLITLVGAIGRTAVVPKSLAGANTARAVGVIPVNITINSRYIELWFRNPEKIADMDSKSHEVARKTLNLEDVRIATVAVAPQEEQNEIIFEADRLLSVAEEIEGAININLKRTERLRQAILKKAFSGRLVSQREVYHTDYMRDLPMAAEQAATYNSKRDGHKKR